MQGNDVHPCNLLPGLLMGICVFRDSIKKWGTKPLLLSVYHVTAVLNKSCRVSQGFPLSRYLGDHWETIREYKGGGEPIGDKNGR